MNPQIRYQIFISSTYEDLREERQQATQAVLMSGNFPSGMELFPASDETQWELIKRVIEECDYYIVIVGGKYGSLGPNGKSYTEMEYDYAMEIGLPVLGFVKKDIEELPSKSVERSEDKRSALEAFREKVQSKSCRLFSDPAQLGAEVSYSLMSEMRMRPRIGWVKADQARSEDDRIREDKLREAYEEATQEIERLERAIRDRSVLVDEIPRESLAQGSDLFDLTIMYRDGEKNYVSEKVPLTWDEIFSVIGPSLYGYILRKGRKTYDRPAGYSFVQSLTDYIRSKIFEKSGNRQITFVDTEIDTFVIQFKELGLIQFAEKEDEDGTVFRGITLTSFGERYLSKLKVSRA